MKKGINKIFVLFMVIIFLGFPLLSLADGMMIPPKEYWIQETGQTGVIMYEDGIETLVLSTSFEGDADDFAWVIPTPNKPEVSKGSQELFTNLEGLTGYNYDNSRAYLTTGAAQDAVKEGVTIIEQKQIDYYDVTVLSSTDKDSLVNWLNENEYNFPSSASYILNSYIENNWYFVAMRINPESLEWTDVSEDLREGQATPIVLTFETKNIVYPLKISSIVDQQSTLEPDYTSGKIGKAITITDDYTLSFPADDSFSTTESTIEMWIKPDATWETSGGGYWEFINVVDENYQDVFEFRRGKDSRLDNLQFIAYNSNGSFLAWKTPDDLPFTWESDKWYYLAVTWSETESPVIYVNGTAYELVPAYSETSWKISNTDSDIMYFGQRGEYGGSILKGDIDEVRISSNLKTATEISNDYQAGLNAQKLTLEDNTLFLGHFDSLKDELSNKNISYESSDYYGSDYIPIVLYVLADNKTTLPDFTTDYANWIDKKSIEKLALDDQGDPLLNPSSKKYFLTKLSTSMTYDEMTDDLFIRDADDNETYGKEIISNDTNSITTFYIAIGSAIALSLIIAILILIVSRKLDTDTKK